MFTSRVYSFVCIFLVGLLYFAWFFYTPTSRNYRDYNKLMSFSDAVKLPASTENLAQQQRKQIHKQFIFAQENERLQWRMQSQHSTICLEKVENSLQLVETLEGMTCEMQEKQKISNTSLDTHRIVRSLEAQQAIFYYQTQQLFAENVLVNRYKLPSNHWNLILSSFSPFMRGHAKKVHLVFSNKPSFKAQGFQAIFEEWD